MWIWFAAYAWSRFQDSVRPLAWTDEHRLALNWVRTVGIAGAVAAGILVRRPRSTTPGTDVPPT